MNRYPIASFSSLGRNERRIRISLIVLKAFSCYDGTVPTTPALAVSDESHAVRYECIEAGFRSIQKGLEARPKSPETAKIIRENLENIASAVKNVRIARQRELRGRVLFFEDVIASIKGAREEMILRRGQADSDAMSRADRLIEMNGQMLEGFAHSLAIVDTLKEESGT
jgi:hypothetical protein